MKPAHRNTLIGLGVTIVLAAMYGPAWFWWADDIEGGRAVPVVPADKQVLTGAADPANDRRMRELMAAEAARAAPGPGGYRVEPLDDRDGFYARLKAQYSEPGTFEPPPAPPAAAAAVDAAAAARTPIADGRVVPSLDDCNAYCRAVDRCVEQAPTAIDDCVRSCLIRPAAPGARRFMADAPDCDTLFARRAAAAGPIRR